MDIPKVAGQRGMHLVGVPRSAHSLTNATHSLQEAIVNGTCIYDYQIVTEVKEEIPVHFCFI